MKKINVFKKTLALITLSTSISLSSCTPAPAPQVVIESNVDYQNEVEETKEPIYEEVIEEEVEQKQLYYNIDETFININTKYDVIISDTKDDNMRFSLSLRELMEKYRYSITSDIVSSSYLDNLVNSVKANLDSTLKEHNYSKLIDVDKIIFGSSYDLKNGKFYNKLYMFEEDYTGIYDRIVDQDKKIEQLQKIIEYRQIRDNFIKEFPEYIVNKDDKKYISIIDYAFLNTNNTICYETKLEDMFSKLPSATDSEIDSYKNGVLRKYGINLEDKKEVFNPNNLDDIEQIFLNYIDNCLELRDSYYSINYDDKDVKDLDYKRIVIKFVALNENIKDETIEYLINTYMPTYNYLSPSEFRTYALNNYYIEIGDESLASIKGIQNALGLYTNLYRNNNIDNDDFLYTLPKQSLSVKNPEKICSELYLMQKVHKNIKEASNIKELITNKYVANFIDIDPFEQIDNLTIPVTTFRPNKDDFNLLSIMLIDDYLSYDYNNLYLNIDKACSRVDKGNLTK